MISTWRLFTQGQYAQAMEENTNAEAITKVLYPSDNHAEGKLLRLTAAVFPLLSASCTEHHPRPSWRSTARLPTLPDKVAIHHQ